MIQALVAVALLAALLLPTPGAGQSPGRSKPPGLAGTTWHTVRIEGGALFFVVRDVGIRFDDDSRFTAAVRLIEGQQTSRAGTYQVPRPGTLVLTIEGLGGPKEVRFRRQGRDLIVHDQPYDVTVRLAPGKLEEERWF
jgi:hypothetical protein